MLIVQCMLDVTKGQNKQQILTGTVSRIIVKYSSNAYQLNEHFCCYK